MALKIKNTFFVLVLAVIASSASTAFAQRFDIATTHRPDSTRELPSTGVYSFARNRPSSFMSSVDYTSGLYTHGAIYIFSYYDDLAFYIQDEFGFTISLGYLDKGTHAFFDLPEGFYSITASNRYSVLIGDPDSTGDGTCGYFAVDQYGWAVSCTLYTFCPDSTMWNFWERTRNIVFAYQDNTNIEISEIGGSFYWSGVLNEGEHHEWDGILSLKYLAIYADKPVSFQHYNDIGYFVPATNGKWAGTKFYAYAGGLTYFGERNEHWMIIGIYDDTQVNLTTDAGITVFDGTLNAGEMQVFFGDYHPELFHAYIECTSDKPVHLASAPILPTGAHLLFVPATDGNPNGTEFYVPACDDSRIVVFGKRDDITVDIEHTEGYSSASYVIDAGEYLQFACDGPDGADRGLYHVVTSDTVGVLEYSFMLAGSEFAPLIITIYEGPIIRATFPQPYAISACDDQYAKFYFDCRQDIDEFTLWATVNGVRVDESWLFFANDTLTVQPPAGYFSDGETVTVFASGKDVLGNTPISTDSITYIIDLTPPTYSNFLPHCGDTITEFSPTISVEIYDEIAGVDSSSVWMTIDDDTVEASFDGTLLTWTPDTNFTNNRWVEICVGAKDSPDLCDSNESFFCCSIYILGYPDLWPDYLGIHPVPPIDEGQPTTLLGWIFNDNYRNVENDFNVCVLLNGENIGSITLHGLPMNTADSVAWKGALDEGDYEICFFADCDSEVTESDETNNVACTTFSVYGSECLIFPNPFTPNGDEVNDYIFFEYPFMYSERAELYIFDTRNRLIYHDNIGPVRDVSNYLGLTWNGRDNQKQSLPEGLYIYIIKENGQVVCNGTVVIAR